MPTINGTADSDTLIGTIDDDTINGLEGNDKIEGGQGDDIIDGGAGDYDGASYETALAGVIVNLGLASDQARSVGDGDAAGIGIDQLANMESIVGSNFDDILTGNAGHNAIYGGAGDDILDGGALGDTMVGGAGDDTYFVDDFFDHIYESGEGFDTVYASVNYHLDNASPPAAIELLSAHDLSATTALWLTGNDHANTIIGNAGNNVLGGEGAADILLGGAGNDFLRGDDGDDRLDGGEGADQSEGGAGNDTHIIDSASDVVLEEAGEGIDTVTIAPTGLPVRDPNSTFFLIDFAYTLWAGSEVEVLIVDPNATGWISVTGNELDNHLIGNDIANRLLGGDGDDHLEGGGGNDILISGEGTDLLEGGAGNDHYHLWHPYDLVVELVGNGYDFITVTGSYSLPSGVEVEFIETGNWSMTTPVALTGNEFGQLIRGNDGDNQIAGLGGSDELYGRFGNDSLDGGEGDDLLRGEAGDDSLTGGAGYDRMYGGVGDDIYHVNDATDFTYELADEGHDLVVASVNHQLRADVEDLQLTGVALVGKGNAGDNGITSNDNDNKLYGLGGNDTIDGGAGDDHLAGAEGNDRLTGGSGYDKMYGGLGDDIFIVNDATDFAYELAGEGTDRVIASLTHTLRGNIEQLELAGTGNVRGYGNGENNLILGNSGANLLYGRDGNDTLNGDAGNDLLYGENGDDSLDAGSGQDRFYGGAGADQYIFANGDFAGLTNTSADRIMDFSQPEGDTVRLDGVDANSLADGDQSFAFIGSGAFTGSAGELRYFHSGTTTYLQGDTDGDGTADFMIRLDGLHTLDAGDFIL